MKHIKILIDVNTEGRVKRW